MFLPVNDLLRRCFYAELKQRFANIIEATGYTHTWQSVKTYEKEQLERERESEREHVSRECTVNEPQLSYVPFERATDFLYTLFRSSR